MSSLSKLSQELIITMEEVARLVAAGEDVLNIARQTNLDVPTIDGILAREEFHTLFRELDAKAYQRWVDDAADLTAKRAVKTMARADSVQLYKEARDLIKTSDQLRDHEKLGHIFTLLKLGGAMDKEQEEERVTLSEGSLELLAGTLKELDEFFRK